jgi:hypothetical protein
MKEMIIFIFIILFANLIVLGNLIDEKESLEMDINVLKSRISDQEDILRLLLKNSSISAEEVNYRIQSLNR